MNVLEGAVHQTAAAAQVAIIPRTVNQLLLTQRHQLPSLPVILAFKRSSLKEIFECYKTVNKILCFADEHTALKAQQEPHCF